MPGSRWCAPTAYSADCATDRQAPDLLGPAGASSASAGSCCSARVAQLVLLSSVSEVDQTWAATSKQSNEHGRSLFSPRLDSPKSVSNQVGPLVWSAAHTIRVARVFRKMALVGGMPDCGPLRVAVG
jgi:hypothetical protein